MKHCELYADHAALDFKIGGESGGGGWGRDGRMSK